MVKDCCGEAFYTKHVQQFNPRKVNGTDMQNTLEGKNKSCFFANWKEELS